jgi:hypothetical protein
MRRPLALALALALLGLVAAPVSAATTQRTWYAGITPGSVNGRATLTASTSGTALLSVALKGLWRGSVYRIEIRAGTCAAIGTLLARVGSVITDATGTAAADRNVNVTQMNKVWSVARTGKIAVRFVSGSSVKCGNLYFYTATRVRIPGYGIDLPVVAGPSGYPYCNVAMYQRILWQPTEPGVTFIYAHARKGMFLPLLAASKVNNGAAMVGKLAYVYASNSVMHTYQITRVRRHVSSIQSSLSITYEKLWLQTSEGPNSSYPKLVIEAKRIATQPAAVSSSHPVPHIVRCG